MNYPTGYESVNIGETIKADWLFNHPQEGFRSTVMAGGKVSIGDGHKYCRPIKHHDPKHWDLSPLPAHRFLAVGEEIKNGDYSYKFGTGPWGPVNGVAIGAKIDTFHLPVCRPIEQPNKESNMLVLELKTVERHELSSFTKSNGVILFKIAKQEGFDWGNTYTASNGIKIESVDCPAYSGGSTFYLRGEEKGKDDTILAVTKEEFAKLQAAIKEILERENRPKFLETITFLNTLSKRRHKANVICSDNSSVEYVDCDTNERLVIELDYISDIQSLPNAF